MIFFIKNNKSQLIRNGITILSVLIALFFMSSYAFKSWHKKTVAKNAMLCNIHARELLLKSKKSISQIASQTKLLSFHKVDFDEFDYADSLLTVLSNEVLVKHYGLEGGFYFSKIDKFVGYSFPTSKPPKPVYGPPPRSYNIIKQQCLKSIEQGKHILETHGFDPAVFPLITVPVVYKNEVVGTIWVRIHIERELPLIKLQNVLNFAAAFLIVALGLVLWFLYRLRTSIFSVSSELEKIHVNPDYRLQSRGKLFEEIVYSMNSTLDKLKDRNKEKRQLEYKLHQREKMASIGRIVAGVAHEVRTPLAIIKTRVQMWQQSLKKPDEIKWEDVITESAVELVITETNRLSNLIKRLLIFSRPIDKKMTNMNIVEQIRETIKILQIQKNSDNIEFELNANNVSVIQADMNSIQQVFINVISNSMEAMPDGGKIVIECQYLENEEEIKIQITDEGTGIPDGIFDKMFELFVTSKPTGVGLGLSISSEIVKAHNGQISFRNGEHKGAVCTIILPVKHD